MGIFRRRRLRFVQEKLPEYTGLLGNPGCGWYHMYPFALGKPVDYDELYWCLIKEETLAQLRIDIGAYRETELPAEALLQLADILTFFVSHKKELIIRIVYDTVGEGLLREPKELATVLRHMRQLGPLLQRYEDRIIVVQGMLIGSWGEMHSSRFLSEQSMRQLADVWLDALGGIPFAVRTPRQWRLLHEPGAQPEDTRIGLFNDGMFGSPSDLGTYGQKPRGEADWYESWCRADELSFTGQLAVRIPYGGEAVGATVDGALKEAVAQMQQTGVCYLNAAYDEARLALWKTECWQEKGVWHGVSGYDYIGAHICCRPVLRAFSVRIKGCVFVDIVLENTGFCGLVRDAKLVVTLEREGSAAALRLIRRRKKAAGQQTEQKTEAPQLIAQRTLPVACACFLPGMQLALSCQMPTPLCGSVYGLYVKLCAADGRVLQLANGDAQERLMLGRVL